jgi:hypothetical protein
MVMLQTFIEGLGYCKALLKWQSREVYVLEFTIISK